MTNSIEPKAASTDSFTYAASADARKNSGYAPLDRRVRIISGAVKGQPSECRISSLRSVPFLVILGEPGMGKSTVLKTEAENANTTVLKVGELLRGRKPAIDSRLFLDALDEFRTDGSASDKVGRLADAIPKVTNTGWVLACRADDWRPGADMSALQHTTCGQTILVVALLPLWHGEVINVLHTLQTPDPERFVERAVAMGAGAFLESPLSLKLLHRAVTDDGDWPQTRFDLFSRAVASMADEDNDEHAYRNMSKAETLADAGTCCLVLLAAGASSLWVTHKPKPHYVGRQEILSSDDIGIPYQRIKNVVSTALFRGEGDAFEPIHRTVAEFLAAETLSRLLQGSSTHAALPLSRALALVTSIDGAPPTELRGVLGWLSAHIGMRNDQAGVTRIIQSDALAVLLYGDAAVLPLPNRRALVAQLGTYELGSFSNKKHISIIGLAGEDLIADFDAILRAKPGNEAQQNSVLDVLKYARPIIGLQPLLLELASDVESAEEMRSRAMAIWIKNHLNTEAACEHLLELLKNQPGGDVRERLRIELLTNIPKGQLNYDDVRAVLADYERNLESNSMIDFYRLHQRLDEDLTPSIFNVPFKSWRPIPRGNEPAEYAVDNLFDDLLARCITVTQNVSAKDFIQWVSKCSKHEILEPAFSTRNAVRTWLDGDVKRDLELLQSLVDFFPDGTATTILNSFSSFAYRSPVDAILIEMLNTLGVPLGRAKMIELKIAVEMVRNFDRDRELYWRVYAVVDEVARDTDLQRYLTTEELGERYWRGVAARIEKRVQDKERHVQRLEDIRPRLADIAAGRDLKLLNEVALVYFRNADCDKSRPDIIDALVATLDAEITNAVLSGWEHSAATCSTSITAATMGEARAKRTHLPIELAATAGMSRLIARQQVSTLLQTPLPLAISILRSQMMWRSSTIQRTLTNWACDRLNFDAEAGAIELVQYWNAALDAGSSYDTIASDLSSFDIGGPVLRMAIKQLLLDRYDGPEALVTSIIDVSMTLLSRDELGAICSTALVSCTMASQRIIWRILALSLNPMIEAERFIVDYFGQDLSNYEENFDNVRMLLSAGSDYSQDQLANFNFVKAMLFGVLTSPQEEDRMAGGDDLNQRLRVVHSAIAEISQHPQELGCSLLKRLAAVPALSLWIAVIRNAQSLQASLMRDTHFVHPSAVAIRQALAGGPPMNSVDLRVVVLEELRELRAELRTADTTPLRSYWNYDSKSAPTPRRENLCRDHLLQRLQDRLTRTYKVAAVLPEVQAADDTRADFVTISQHGTKLPVEVKRHYNATLWTAASSQLQGYASDPKAFGCGIYLVFWFGIEIESTPLRDDGARCPETAEELERMLVADLSSEIKPNTDILVFDVSGPGMPKKSAVNSRAKKTSTRKPARS